MTPLEPLPPSARVRTWTLMVAGVLVLCFGAAGLSTVLIGGAGDDGSAALHLADARASIARLTLHQAQLALGAPTVDHEDVQLVATVRSEFALALPGLRELDAEVASSTSALLDRYLGALERWHGAATAPMGSDPTARRSDADAFALDVLAPTARALDDVLSAAAAEAAEHNRDAVRRSVAAVWAGATLRATVLVVAAIAVYRVVRRNATIRRDRLADERLRALVAHNDEVLVVFDATGEHVQYLSPSFERVLGYTPDPTPGRAAPLVFVRDEDRARWHHTVAAVLTDGGHRRIALQVRHADGGVVHLEVDVSNLVHVPSIAGIVLNGRDISERVNRQRDVAHQATHDALTGLANRAAFADRVTQALRTHARQDISVLLVDLDGFKDINDSLGHAAGDEVLVTLAARLATLTRQRDCVARLGGDEFALLLIGDHTDPLAQRIVERLSEPVELAVGPVSVGGSVGVAGADAASTVVSLLRNADAAMYDAKAKGKNRVSQYDPCMHDSLVERLRIRGELDRAIADGEFELVYQPKVDLDDGHIEGFEALIRWPRPDGSVAAPAAFIPVAERTGQIAPIGQWVLRTALGQLACWQHGAAAGRRLTMAVNVSTGQLSSPGFAHQVRAALGDTGIHPADLTLEITETMLMDRTDAAAVVLGELRRLGVRIAVDDYGSGHASIGYLRDLPVDELKIDPSFVAGLDARPHEAKAYLRSITELAGSLGLETVAEGIEHESHLRELRHLGCRHGQGLHLAQPLDAHHATLFLLHGAAASR